jgi:hypothetical protein
MTREYKPFTPGERAYPSMTSAVTEQVSRVATTSDGGLAYCPCSVLLVDGTIVDCVFLVEAQAYIRPWGVWPDQDSGKREVRIQYVVHVRESPHRLPASLAQRLYDAGESGMGYVLFEIEYRDGSRSAHVSGNAVDFVRLAEGKVMSDAIAVYPHEGRNKHLIEAPEYAWCLYGTAQSKR